MNAPLPPDFNDPLGVLRADHERLLEMHKKDAFPSADEEFGALDFPINPVRVAPILRRWSRQGWTDQEAYFRGCASRQIRPAFCRAGTGNRSRSLRPETVPIPKGVL